nr:PREDICTED: ubiquitin carboxyl-terminal hydrolase CYLD-like [Notothenia coriiceps]
MPRFGKDFKMFDAILPTLSLDITDLLDDTLRQCSICQAVAEWECLQCYEDPDITPGRLKQYCSTCNTQVHSHRKRASHHPVDVAVPGGPWTGPLLSARQRMSLFAVTCIETSHYVSFVKHGPLPTDWMFFDSMADREGKRPSLKVEEARLNFEREPTLERRGVLNEAKQFIFSTYDTIKGEELMESVRRVQAAQGERQYGEAWRVINEMTGRKRTKEGRVEGHSPEERVTTWFNHFQSLLGTIADGAEESIPAFLQNLPINDGPFTASELARAKSTPDIWSLSNITLVPKAGDLSKPDNYRGISLTCITAKVYNRMILKRIRHAIDSHLREN